MKGGKEMKKLIITSLVMISLIACGQKKEEQAKKEEKVEVQNMDSKGIGPIKEVKLGPIDKALVEKGKKIFEEKCSACHKIEEKYVGPPIKGVTKRRTPEWIMNMILNPVEMTQKDSVAKQLLAEYLTQMTYQNVSEEDTRAILEYFRSIDSQ